MKTIFYDDETIRSFTPRSIFLAGPTGRDVVRTPWRQQALNYLNRLRPEGISIVPEFRDRKFDRAFFERQHPSAHSSGIWGDHVRPGMRRSTQIILNWETAGIDNCNVLLVWMPFCDNLPGRTTRCEVSRAIAQLELDRSRDLGQCRRHLVLGIPDDADSTGHIRYHAANAGIRVHKTLLDCCIDAARRTRYYGDVDVPVHRPDCKATIECHCYDEVVK